MSHIHAVTVYCSSSANVAAHFAQASRQLGELIARQRWTLIYGGNCIGCMATLAQGARGAGGKVVGITPQLLVTKGIADQNCDELVVTKTIRERKAILEERGDAFIALPGGMGTLEEIFEIIVGRQLGLHNKPIVLVNIDRYYNPLLAMIEHGIDGNFIRRRVRELYFVAQSVGQSVDFLVNGPPDGAYASAQTPNSPVE